MKYCVIVGDLVSSRKMKKRDDEQKALKKIMDEINTMYRSDIVAPFMITRGDEIAAVLKSVRNVNVIINYFIDHLYPSKIRFGIGLGNLTTSVETELATEMDGPGFYQAAEALEEIRKARRWIGFRLNNKDLDKYLTALKNILISIKLNWTEQQREIIRYMINLNNQEKVGDKLHISQQSVAKTLKKALWKDYIDGEETIDIFFKR